MNSFIFEEIDMFKHKTPVGIPKIPAGLDHPEKITHFGNTVLWVGFAAMTLGSVVFASTTAKTAYKYRAIHVTTLFVNLFAAISYYAMATDIGKTFVHSGGRASSREVFYARYIDWAITTPLLLLDLTLLAGMPIAEIIVAIVADIIMIVTGVVGALHPSLTYRWGFYAFSWLAYLYVAYAVLGSGRSCAQLKGSKVASLFNQVALTLVVVWTAYPVVWYFAEGTGKISGDNEVLSFAILDIIAKPIWGAWLVFAIPEEGHVVLSDFLAAPLGGGYSAVAGGDDA